VIVGVEGLVVRRSDRDILGPLDLAIRDGERWVVIGPNGSGKTTLLAVLGLTLWPTGGVVRVLGDQFGKVDSRELRRRIGLASSAIEGQLRPDLTSVDLVMTARHAATEPWWHVFTDADRQRARALLDELGLAGVADHPFGTLSAGERRRTSIARALMPDPDVLLLDEPAASLDLGAREALLRDLTVLAARERPAALVLVTHHVEEIPPGFTHAIALRAGQIVGSGAIDDVITGKVLTATFQQPIAVDRRNGRVWAHLATPDPDDDHRKSDTLPSHESRIIRT
jgi:iron complex transport system ATP-binding protein